MERIFKPPSNILKNFHGKSLNHITKLPYLSYGDQYQEIFREKSSQFEIMYIVLPKIRPIKIEMMKRSKTEDLSLRLSTAPRQQTNIPKKTTHKNNMEGLNVENI